MTGKTIDNLIPETYDPPLPELVVQDNDEFLLQVYEHAKRRALELRSAENAGTGTIEESREAHGWLGLIRGIQDFGR